MQPITKYMYLQSESWVWKQNNKEQNKRAFAHYTSFIKNIIHAIKWYDSYHTLYFTTFYKYCKIFFKHCTADNKEGCISFPINGTILNRLKKKMRQNLKYHRCVSITMTDRKVILSHELGNNMHVYNENVHKEFMK